jgi:hypothetical protein
MCVACLTYLLENSSGAKRILSPSNSLQFVKLLLNKSVYPHEVSPSDFPPTASLTFPGEGEILLRIFSSTERRLGVFPLSIGTVSNPLQSSRHGAQRSSQRGLVPHLPPSSTPHLTSCLIRSLVLS